MALTHLPASTLVTRFRERKGGTWQGGKKVRGKKMGQDQVWEETGEMSRGLGKGIEICSSGV